MKPCVATDNIVHMFDAESDISDSDSSECLSVSLLTSLQYQARVNQTVTNLLRCYTDFSPQSNYNDNKLGIFLVILKSEQADLYPHNFSVQYYF